MRVFRSASALFLTALLVGSFSNAAQMPRAHRDAISTIADYTAASPDGAGRMLRDLGYKPPVPESVWNRYPAIRKIETAYAAAEHAAPRSGGQRLMTALARKVAVRYESARTTIIGRYVSQPDRKPVKFMNPPATGPPRLPTETRQLIRTIADYCRGGPLGSPHAVLRDHFGISEQEAHRLLSTSHSIDDAFARALATKSETQQQRCLRGITEKLASRYEAVWHEPALRPYLPDRETKRRGTEPPEPQNTSRRSPPPSRGPGPSERYQQFVKQNYPGDIGGFASVVAEKGGFGGVVFGNTIVDEERLPPVRSIRYEGSALTFRFTNGRVARYAPVTREAAAAAYRIVYSGSGRLPPIRPGQAIGLASVNSNNIDYRTCQERTTAYSMIGHPAIADQELGWAAMMTDTLPIFTDELFAMVQKSAGREARAAVEQFFVAMREPKNFALNWKIVDVPMVVSLAGDRLVIKRGHDAPFPIGLRSTCFIELRPFYHRVIDGHKKAQADKAVTASFYRTLPMLLRSSRDFAEVNSFAPVLGLFRWAKEKGAVFEGSPPKPVKRPAPAAVAFIGKRIVAIPALSETAIALRKYDACARRRSGH